MPLTVGTEGHHWSSIEGWHDPEKWRSFAAKVDILRTYGTTDRLVLDCESLFRPLWSGKEEIDPAYLRAAIVASGLDDSFILYPVTLSSTGWQTSLQTGRRLKLVYDRWRFASGLARPRWLRPDHANYHRLQFERRLVGNYVPWVIFAIGRKCWRTEEALARVEQGMAVCLFDNATLDEVGRVIRRRWGKAPD